MPYISVNHSLKIDLSAHSFSEPFTENSTNPNPAISYFSPVTENVKKTFVSSTVMA